MGGTGVWLCAGNCAACWPTSHLRSCKLPCLLKSELFYCSLVGWPRGGPTKKNAPLGATCSPKNPTTGVIGVIILMAWYFSRPKGRIIRTCAANPPPPPKCEHALYTPGRNTNGSKCNVASFSRQPPTRAEEKKKPHCSVLFPPLGC